MAKINRFFFDDLSVPFINFRESKGVTLTTVTQIIKNEESDVVRFAYPTQTLELELEENTAASDSGRWRNEDDTSSLFAA